MKTLMLLITLFAILLSDISVNAQPLVTDFQVNDNEDGYVEQSNPRIIPVGNNILTVFKDTRGYFAQWFDSDRSALTDNIQLEGAWWVTAAVSDSGNMMVVWPAGFQVAFITTELKSLIRRFGLANFRM